MVGLNNNVVPYIYCWFVADIVDQQKYKTLCQLRIKTIQSTAD